MMVSNKKIKKLKNLFEFLYEENRYYHNLFVKNNFNPYDNDPISIYMNLPIMTKTDLLKHQKDILTSSLNNQISRIDVTSGTTGIVLPCYKTAKESSILALNLWRNRRRIDSKVSPENFISLFSDEVEDLIGHFYLLDQQSILNNWKKICSLSPRWLSGPLSLIEKFSDLVESNPHLYSESLCYIEFMGENVLPYKRKKIEKILKCKTISNYSAQELWCIAYECSNQCLHVEENCIVEIVNPDENGIGNILITSLSNYLMPIIRYNIGDKGKIINEPCDCKSDKPKLVLSEGRTGDLIYNTEIIGSYFFDQIIWDINQFSNGSIFGFQAEQVNKELFILRIIKGENYSFDVEKIIEARMKNEISSSINVKFEYVTCLKASKNGKLKKFIPLPRR